MEVLEQRLDAVDYAIYGNQAQEDVIAVNQRFYTIYIFDNT